MSDFNPQGQSDAGTEVPPDSLASPFLEKIPEADRNVVAKYVNDWDSGVTQKFKSIHDSYKGYKELGEIEELKAAQNIYNLLTTDPQGSVKYMIEELKSQGVDVNKLLGIETPQTQTPVPPKTEQGNQQVQGIPEELKKQLEDQQKVLMALAQDRQAQIAAQQQQQEDEQLTNFLHGLSEKHGDFDEDWVLLQVHRGKAKDMEQAVIQYHEKFGKPGGFRPPPALTGGAAIPSGTQSIAEMSDKDTKNLVASFLAAANQQRQ